MATCKHDLEGGCADCRTGPPAVSPRLGHQPGFGPWFPAQFDGDCDGCGADIIEGDQIRADGEGGWMCKTCGLQDERRDADLAAANAGLSAAIGQARPSLAAFLDQYREGP